MVHLEDAKATLAAVMCSHWFPRLLPRTLNAILVLSVLARKRCDHAFGYASRVRKGRPDVTQVRHQAKPIERNKVEEALHCERDPLNELLVDERLLVPIENVRSVSNVLAIDN